MPKIRNARNVINIWPLCGHVLSGTQRHERNLDHGTIQESCAIKQIAGPKETCQSLEFSLTLLTFCEIPLKERIQEVGNILQKTIAALCLSTFLHIRLNSNRSQII